MKTFALMAGLILIAGTAQAEVQTGFASGSEFTAIPIRGELSVHCDTGNQSDWAIHDCRDVLLEPRETDYFVTQPGGEADKVTLRGVQSDGTVRKKEEKFDPATGRSKGRVNLWLVSLFQRPLLNYGKTEIHYQLLKGDQIEREGDFTVNVADGQRRTCRRGMINSRNMNDCRSSASVCDSYFRQENYCR